MLEGREGRMIGKGLKGEKEGGLENAGRGKGMGLKNNGREGGKED